MKSQMLFACCAVGLIAPVGRFLQADDATSSNHGRVLILDNDRTLDGDVERVGEQYRVRWTTGEILLPANRVRRVCADKDEAYAYLRSAANLNDPDERLRLARWCHAQGMKKQALDEVSAAVQLRPKHAPSRRWLEQLQKANADTPPSPALVPESEAKPTAPPTAELSAECLGKFTTKVQPILMNACASCHASDKGGEFKLMRVSQPGSAQRRSSQQNLTAVLAQVNLAKPELSPLLSKAASAHGELVQAPLRGRQAAAYKELDEWVRQVASASAPAPENKPAAMENKPPAKPPTAPVSETKPAAETPKEDGFAGQSEPAKPATTSSKDPFDPAIFNEQAQRGRK